MHRSLSAAVLVAATGCSPDYELTPEPPNVDPGDVTACGFTRVSDLDGSDTDFYAYDCNPVFSTTGEDWARTIDSTAFMVTEVLGHPFYQLWYTGVPDSSGYGDYGLGYAISAEGTEWEPHPANPLLEHPADSAWDASGMDAMQLVWDPAAGGYVMLYQGYNLDRDRWGLGVATSSDGKNWSRLPDNPVVDLTERGPGDVQGYCWPLGLTLGEIAGYTGYVAGYDKPNGPCQVYTLAGSSVSDWTPKADLVLPAGERGAWDDEGMISLAIAELDGEKYMFYVGFGEWIDHSTYRSSSKQFLGMATWSGGEWVKRADPLPLHTAREGLVGAVAARTVGERIHIWITDDYDGISAVGYFLYDPYREEEEEEEPEE